MKRTERWILVPVLSALASLGLALPGKVVDNHRCDAATLLCIPEPEEFCEEDHEIVNGNQVPVCLVP